VTVPAGLVDRGARPFDVDQRPWRALRDRKHVPVIIGACRP